MQERGRREKQESLLARDEGERREGAKADRREDTDGQRGAGTAEDGSCHPGGQGAAGREQACGGGLPAAAPQGSVPQSVRTWGACSTPTCRLPGARYRRAKTLWAQVSPTAGVQQPRADGGPRALPFPGSSQSIPPTRTLPPLPPTPRLPPGQGSRGPVGRGRGRGAGKGRPRAALTFTRRPPRSPPTPTLARPLIHTHAQLPGGTCSHPPFDQHASLGT